VRIVEAANNRAMLVNVGRSASVPYLRKGDVSKAIPLLERGLELHRVGINPRLFADLAAALGAAYALAHRVDEALPLLGQAVAPSALRQAYQSALPFLWVSEAYLRLGRVEDASQCAERALALAREHHERGHEARSLYLLGEIAMQRDVPESDQAEACFRLAPTLAEALGMRPFQTHCHLDLSRLYGKTQRAQEAHAELTTAINMYREMEMTFWLPQAEAALAEVDG
jgi:tetratricopeptide (TPR) repeat protein